MHPLDGRLSLCFAALIYLAKREAFREEPAQESTGDQTTELSCDVKDE